MRKRGWVLQPGHTPQLSSDLSTSLFAAILSFFPSFLHPVPPAWPGPCASCICLNGSFLKHPSPSLPPSLPVPYLTSVPFIQWASFLPPDTLGRRNPVPLRRPGNECHTVRQEGANLSLILQLRTSLLSPTKLVYMEDYPWGREAAKLLGLVVVPHTHFQSDTLPFCFCGSSL